MNAIESAVQDLTMQLSVFPGGGQGEANPFFRNPESGGEPHKCICAAIHIITSGTTKCFQSPAGHLSVELVNFISKELTLHNGLLLALLILLKFYSNLLKFYPNPT